MLLCLRITRLTSSLAPTAAVPQVRSDWVAIIDAWAGRFLDEMNYELEARNTLQFQRGERRCLWHGSRA